MEDPPQSARPPTFVGDHDGPTRMRRAALEAVDVTGDFEVALSHLVRLTRRRTDVEEAVASLAREVYLDPDDWRLRRAHALLVGALSTALSAPPEPRVGDGPGT